MRTKQEILEHLKRVPYTKKSALKIIGFLSAVGYIEISERLEFRSRMESVNSLTFDKFIAWYNDDTFDKNVFDGLRKDLEESLKDALDDSDTNSVDRITNQIRLLNKYIGIKF